MMNYLLTKTAAGVQKLIILPHKPNENEVRKKASLQREELITT